MSDIYIDWVSRLIKEELNPGHGVRVARDRQQARANIRSLQQLNELCDFAEENFEVIQDYYNSYDTAEHRGNVVYIIEESLIKGYNINSYFPKPNAHPKAQSVHSAIDNLAQVATYLKAFLNSRADQEYLLNDDHLLRFNLFLKEAFNRLNGSILSDNKISFNKWNDPAAKQLSIEELSSLFNLPNSDILFFQPKIVYNLKCFFSFIEGEGPNFIEALRKIIEENRTHQLYFNNIRNILLALVTTPNSETTLLNKLNAALYYNLNVVIGELKEETNYCETSEEEEIEINLLNVILKQVELAIEVQQFNEVNDSVGEYSKLGEICDKYFLHTDARNDKEPIAQLDYMLNNTDQIKFWITIAQCVGIEKCELLFNDKFSDLFSGNFLMELYKALAEGFDHNHPTKHVLNCFTKDTKEYEVMENLRELSTSNNFRMVVELLEDTVNKYKEGLIYKEVRCESSEDLPTGPSLSNNQKKEKPRNQSRKIN